MKVRTAIDSIKPYVPGELRTGAVKLASNENPFGPSPLALETIRRDAEQVYLYPDQHAVKLRSSLAHRYRVREDQVMVGNGSDELMMMVAGTFLEDGMTTITAAVTFSQYAFSALLFGGKVVQVPLDSGRYDLSAMRAAVTEITKLVFICNPNNPTGTYVTHAELHEFLSGLPDHVLVVIDEAYAEFSTAADFPDSMELIRGFPNLVVLRTFSKIYGLAGMRIGYGIGRSDIIRDVLRVKQPFNVGLLAQAAATAALADEDFVRRSIQNNREGKEYLYGELKKLGLVYHPTEANFICINTMYDSMKLFERIMELGVTIRPLRSFGMPNSIRVTIGTPEQTRLFVRCLKTALSECADGA